MTLTNLFSDIANAIRAKTGGTAPIVAADFPAAIAGISGGGKNTKTIHIDWSGDEELIVEATYLSDGKVETIYHEGDTSTIEADGGVVYMVCMDVECSNDLVLLNSYGTGYVLVAINDGGTIYPISTGEMQ